MLLLSNYGYDDVWIGPWVNLVISKRQRVNGMSFSKRTGRVGVLVRDVIYARVGVSV
jgi:hypothetical protein